MARTRLSSWQIPVQEERGKMNYVQLKYDTIAHVANDTVVYKIDFPKGIEGINIKTIRIISDERVAFIARLLDDEGDFPIYETLEEIQYQYDNVDIAYKPNKKAIFVEILNKGDLTTKFHIDIRGIEVK